MSSTTAMAAHASPSREETGSLVGQTMGLVAVAAGVFALGAYLGRDVSGGWALFWFIAAFGFLFAMDAGAARSERLAVAVLFAFALVLGLAVAPTVAYYAGTDPEAVYEAGGATALLMAGVGAAGFAISATCRHTSDTSSGPSSY
jgi:FtsH-binding integral membrane protein